VVTAWQTERKNKNSTKITALQIPTSVYVCVFDKNKSVNVSPFCILINGMGSLLEGLCCGWRKPSRESFSFAGQVFKKP
jgi:hypothetical protein